MNTETKTTSAGKDAFHRVPNISINPVNPINPFSVEPTLQHSNTPTAHSSALTQFSQPAILEAIGLARLTRFLNEFAPKSNPSAPNERRSMLPLRAWHFP